MKKALIIGGSGGLSGVLARMAQDTYEVYAVTRGIRPLGEGVHALTADRNDGDAFEKAVSGQHWDVVFDCICMNELHARQDIEVLQKVTERLVVVSTDSVYDHRYKKTPQTEEGVFVEEEGTPDTLGYAANKRRMEKTFQAYMEQNPAMKITLFRPGHIFGPGFLPGCFPSHSRQADLAQHMRAGKPLYLVGMGTYIIQPIYVDDLAKTMLDCVDKEGAYQEIFCIGGPEAVENRIYYEIIADILGVKAEIHEIPLEGFLEKHPEYSGHLCHRIYNMDKLKAAGVALPATDIRTGMKRMLTGLSS